MSGSFEFLLKLGNLPGHRLDYVFSATEGLRITDAYGLVSCTVHLSTPLMVTDSISGTMKMFGREVKSDPVSNYLFNKLKKRWSHKLRGSDFFSRWTVLCSGCGQGE